MGELAQLEEGLTVNHEGCAVPLGRGSWWVGQLALQKVEQQGGRVGQVIPDRLNGRGQDGNAAQAELRFACGVDAQPSLVGPGLAAKQRTLLDQQILGLPDHCLARFDRTEDRSGSGPGVILEGFKPGTAPPDSYSIIGFEGDMGRPLTVTPEANRAVISGTGGLY